VIVSNGGGISHGPTSFERLGFAAQMIVWAVRKRLHLLRNGSDDSDAARAFEIGGLDRLHASLMTVIDVLLCGSSSLLELHSVSCPCLAPHEVALLNAVAHLQHGRRDEANASLRALFCRPAIGLVLPAMLAIVRELEARDLRVLPVANPLGPRSVAAALSTTIH
jgi:hypothetical protein